MNDNENRWDYEFRVFRGRNKRGRYYEITTVRCPECRKRKRVINLFGGDIFLECSCGHRDDFYYTNFG